MKIRVAIADDHRLVTESLSLILENRADDIEVVGTASNAEQIIELAQRAELDVILMDIRMPGMTGVDAAAIIRRTAPSCRVIILTTYDDDEYIAKAWQVGAVGYLLKDISTEKLIASIRAAYAGVRRVSPQLIGRVVSGETPDEEVDESYATDSRSTLRYELNEKEREILRLLLRGYDNREIAETVSLSYQTVKNYVSSIYASLDVKNRREARRFFRDRLPEPDRRPER